ncbi:MAG TPA: O-antigen ligase family protein [Pyrinomonadaceae bacterium]|jgi:O-antigen ligase|nr:O-antigen ligase family protein [Pyrinomonadaceae bacterium]
MTTLASNAPAQPTPSRVRATDARSNAHRSPSGDETERTLASRFIILMLCLTVALSTLAFGTVHSWSLAIFYMGAGAVVVAWAADAWRSRRLRVSRNVLQLPLAALILLGLVQLLPLGTGGAGAALPLESARTISFDPYATRFVLIQLVALFIYFAAALSFIDSQKRLRLVVRTIIIFAFALSVVSMILFFISPDRVFGIREMKQSQGFGPFINRHHFAAYMELALALPLGLLFSGALAGERRPLYIFAAALMGISIILTNSRGGMVSLVAEIMFLVMVSGVGLRQRGDKERGTAEGSRLRGALKRAVIGFAIIIALFTGVLFFGGESALNRLVGTVNAEDPTTGRMHFWRGTLGIIRDHPVVGVGLGGFSAAYSKYDTSNGKLFRLEQAHNDYLQTLSDAGLVGAALGLFFIVALFRMSFRRMQSNSSFRRGVALGALSGCFALLVHSFFDFTLHTTANALLFLLLAALATINGRVEHTSRRRSTSSSSRRPPPPDATKETPALEQDGETSVAAQT